MVQKMCPCPIWSQIVGMRVFNAAFGEKIILSITSTSDIKNLFVKGTEAEYLIKLNPDVISDLRKSLCLFLMPLDFLTDLMDTFTFVKV